MVTQTPWLERKFNFDFPVGVYPNLVERLRGTPARLEEMVRSLAAELVTQRVGDKWTIQEHCGHLYDVDGLHEARLDEYLARATNLTPADLARSQVAAARHHQSTLEDILSTFRSNRMRIVKRLEEVDEETAAHSAHHPRLDVPMRAVDCLLFAAEHDDHHLAIISRMIRELRR